MSSSRHYSSKAHQRDNRTALFQTSNGSQTFANGIIQDHRDEFKRSSSPYEINSNASKQQKDFSASSIASLESQSDETMNIMSLKISSLKDLSMKMGDQISKSKAGLGSLNGDFDKAGSKIKGNLNRMVIMAERYGISWKTWLSFFAVVFLFFLFVKYF